MQFRDLWVKVKTTADLILGKRESNGVYLGKDGYLLEACAYPDSRHYPQNVKAIQSFARVHPSLNISMIVVPDAAAVLTDKLPSFAPVPDQKEMLDKLYASLETDLTMIDVYPGPLFSSGGRALLPHRPSLDYAGRFLCLQRRRRNPWHQPGG